MNDGANTGEPATDRRSAPADAAPRAAALDLTRLEIPPVYGGLGLDPAVVIEQVLLDQHTAHTLHVDALGMPAFRVAVDDDVAAGRPEGHAHGLRPLLGAGQELLAGVVGVE